MDSKKVNNLLEFHKDGLLSDTIPFWLKHSPDRKYGGFFNYLDCDGSIYNDDKAVWIQGRFTWLLSLLYNTVEKKSEWLEAARLGIEFIEKYCFDTDGRMFYEVTRDGQPLRKRRYLFAETFGTIALSEYSLATGDCARLAKARQLYELIVWYYRNPDLLPQKVFPKTRQSKSHAMPMILLATTQQIRKAGNDGLYDEIINHSLKEIFEHFMDYKRKALLETVGVKGEKMNTPEGRCVNPGHAIETAWFIMTEGKAKNDRTLIEKGCLILDWSLKLGWDEKYGGLFYFIDIEGKPTVQYEHDMKLWWPHTEALYACLLAHYLTGKKEYEDWYDRIHEWTYAHFPDKEHGEWYKYLHRDGSISITCKSMAWGGPFHLPRMQLYCWKLLEEMRK